MAKIRKTLNDISEDRVISSLKDRFKGYFFVSEKIKSRAHKKFLVLRPDKYIDFVRDISRNEEIDLRMRIYLIVSCSGATRGQEALNLKMKDFSFNADGMLQAEIRILKKRTRVTYGDVLEDYLSKRVNQNPVIKKRRRESITKSLILWGELVKNGVNLAKFKLQDSDLSAAQRLAISLGKISADIGRDQIFNVLISSELSSRFKLFFAAAKESTLLKKANLNDIMSIKEHFDRIKKTGELGGEKRSFLIINDRDDYILNLFTGYLEGLRKNEHIFQSKRDLSRPYKMRSHRPLKIQNLNKILKSTFGTDGGEALISSHSWRHGLITYLLHGDEEMSRPPLSKMQIARTFKIGPEVVEFYANLNESKNLFSDKI